MMIVKERTPYLTGRTIVRELMSTDITPAAMFRKCVESGISSGDQVKAVRAFRLKDKTSRWS